MQGKKFSHEEKQKILFILNKFIDLDLKASGMRDAITTIGNLIEDDEQVIEQVCSRINIIKIINPINKKCHLRIIISLMNINR